MTVHTSDSLNYLKQLWSDAQQDLHRKPRNALQNARVAAERICKNLCLDQRDRNPDERIWKEDFESMMLGKMINKLYNSKAIPRIINTNLTTIQHFGNMGAHDMGAEHIHLQAQYIESCLSALTSVILWYFDNFGREEHRNLVAELKLQQKSSDFQELFSCTQETAHELEQIILGSINQVRSMQLLATRYLQRTSQEDRHPLCDALEDSRRRKNLYHMDNGDEIEHYEIEDDDGASLIGNLTGEGSVDDRSPEFWREVSMALSLTPSFEIAKRLIPDSKWVYYTSARRFIYIMPWESHKRGAHCYSNNLLTLSFFTDGLPENNPERAFFWTPPYRDEYGLGLMVTVAAPVDDDEHFLGTVAIDLSLELFNRHLRSNELSDATLILVNEHHHVLGHPNRIHTSDSQISNLWDVENLINSDHKEFLDELQPCHSILLGQREIFYVPVANTNWRLYCVRR